MLLVLVVFPLVNAVPEQSARNYDAYEIEHIQCDVYGCLAGVYGVFVLHSLVQLGEEKYAQGYCNYYYYYYYRKYAKYLPLFTVEALSSIH